MANQIRSLGCIWKNCQKYWLFGPFYVKNWQRTLKISKYHWVSIQFSANFNFGAKFRNKIPRNMWRNFYDIKFNIPKMLSFIKIHSRRSKISSILCQKDVWYWLKSIHFIFDIISQWEIGWLKFQEVILPDFVFSFSI